MGDFREYLKEKIKKEISGWDKAGIYAVYIGVTDNNRVDEPLELPFILELGYGRGKKKDWRLACGIGNEKDMIENADERDMLIGWLEDMGVENIGVEDPAGMFDKSMGYIGKGPAGMYETLEALTEIVKELFSEGFIADSFGGDIPVIFDSLETTWYHMEATKKANPEGLADEYFKCFDEDMERFRKMSLSPYMMIGSAVRTLAFLPCAMLSAVITVISGGIHIPLGVSGIVKGAAVLAAAVKRSMYMLRLKRSYNDVGSSRTRTSALFIMITVLDIGLGVLALFSWTFLPERLMGSLYLLGVVIYIAADYHRVKKAAGGLLEGDLMDSMEELIRKNGSFKPADRQGDNEQ